MSTVFDVSLEKGQVSSTAFIGLFSFRGTTSRVEELPGNPHVLFPLPYLETGQNPKLVCAQKTVKQENMNYCVLRTGLQ